MSSPTFTAAAIIDPTNGSLRQLRSYQGGWPIKKYPHSVWGETTADTGAMVRMRFAGREYDAETGLYFMRARYYDPAVGRFISEDPIGIGGGMNLYAYAGSDPINLRDPFGLDPCNPDDPKCKPHKLPENVGLGTPPFPPPMDDPLERREAFEAHEYGHLRPDPQPAPTWGDCGRDVAAAAFQLALDVTAARLIASAARLARYAANTKDLANTLSRVDHVLFGRAAQRASRAVDGIASARAARVADFGRAGVSFGALEFLGSESLDDTKFAMAGAVSAFVKNAPYLGTAVAGFKAGATCFQAYRAQQ